MIDFYLVKLKKTSAKGYKQILLNNIIQLMELNTYLGQKGYTIHKSELTIEQQKQIRNDLTIKPFSLREC